VLLFVPVRLLLGLVTGVATALLARALGVEGVDKLPVIVAGVAGFVIVCELLLPLLIVASNPEKVLELLLPTFAPVARLLKPFTLGISRSMAAKRPSQAMTPTESDEEATEVAKAYIDTAEQEGIIQGEERQLLRSIVDFGDTLVREVMTPRPDIVAVKDDATIGTVRALFREQEYSRFPVYRDSLDNISGFIFIKDLWGLPPTALEDQPIKPLVRPLVVVPETKQVSELLKQFQRQQTQCAIVVDEYGGTAGLVTLEDLLEEIVGEIRDEYDVESEPIVDEGRGRFVFSGKVNIDEVAQRLDVEIEREGFETVGGFLMHHIGRVPQAGEKFDIEDVTVEVLDAERRRINRVRMCKRSARPSQEEQTA
jgi:CBS domain containing-hemolysin-like protein